MSDTAAFFAKKNKKKKVNKFSGFNANRIDVSQVSSSIIESEVSKDQPPSMNALTINQTNDDTGDWDESALASKVAKPAPTIATNGPAEIKDMRAFVSQRSEQDDIAERMRVEETKQKLAAAREGMEKEAQRLKEEKGAKETKKQENSQPSNRFGQAAANIGGGASGGKYVPAHLRNRSTPASGPGPSGSRFGAAASATGYQKKVDTNDEELFPDLATADKLIQDVENQKIANAAAAAKANKAKAIASKPRWGIRAEKKEEKPIVEEEKPVSKEAEAPVPVAAATSAAPVVKKKKKKKKDLSTFKSS